MYLLSNMAILDIYVRFQGGSWISKKKKGFLLETLFRLLDVDEDRVTWAVQKHPLFHDTILTGWLIGILIVKRTIHGNRAI